MHACKSDKAANRTHVFEGKGHTGSRVTILKPGRESGPTAHNLGFKETLGTLMGCHKLPRDTGCWLRVPGLNRFCTLCQQGVLGDEKHLVFECPALQDLRDMYENLFQAPQGDAMILFKWQDDMVGLAWFIDASAGPPVGAQASDQP